VDRQSTKKQYFEGKKKLVNRAGGYLAVVAPCRDGLDSGSVLGHHLVTAARGGAHLRARVVNKNQTDSHG